MTCQGFSVSTERVPENYIIKLMKPQKLFYNHKIIIFNHSNYIIKPHKLYHYLKYHLILQPPKENKFKAKKTPKKPRNPVLAVIKLWMIYSLVAV